MYQKLWILWKLFTFRTRSLSIAFHPIIDLNHSNLKVLYIIKFIRIDWGQHALNSRFSLNNILFLKFSFQHQKRLMILTLLWRTYYNVLGWLKWRKFHLIVQLNKYSQLNLRLSESKTFFKSHQISLLLSHTQRTSLKLYPPKHLNQLIFFEFLSAN